jgi:hypothetical protein
MSGAILCPPHLSSWRGRRWLHLCSYLNLYVSPVSTKWKKMCLEAHSFLSCFAPRMLANYKSRNSNSANALTCYLQLLLPKKLKDYSLIYVTGQLSMAMLTVTKSISSLPWSKHISVKAKKRIFYTATESILRLGLGNMEDGLQVKENC